MTIQLPAREAQAAVVLRDLGFPVKGCAAFHTEMFKGDDLHVAIRKARLAGHVIVREAFVPAGPRVQNEHGRELAAFLRGEA